MGYIFGTLFIQIRIICWLSFWVFFVTVLESVWEPRWRDFGIIVSTFLDFSKKAPPYESVVNSSRIGGGARRKTTKQLITKQRKNGIKTKTTNIEF